MGTASRATTKTNELRDEAGQAKRIKKIAILIFHTAVWTLNGGEEKIKGRPDILAVRISEVGGFYWMSCHVLA